MNHSMRVFSVLMTAVVALGVTDAGQAQAQTPAPASGKQVLQHIDFPAPAYYTEITRAEMAPHAQAPFHLHPGIESGYFIRGGGTLYVQGQPDRVVHAGDSVMVPPNTPHYFINGDAPTEVVATYVLEAGKPAMTVLASMGEAATASHETAPAVATTAAATAPIVQTVLQNIDYPGHGYYTRIVRTAVAPDAKAPLHVHPGIETTYVLAGHPTLSVAGQADRLLNPGDSFVIPANTAHRFSNGALPTEMLSTYVLATGEPVMSLVK